MLIAVVITLMVNKAVYADEPPNAYGGIEISAEDRELVAKILALEATGEPMEGQIAVVEVILNRVLSDEFPDTVYKVLSQRGEFSSWKYINKPYNTPTDETYSAVDYVIANGATILPTDYLYFSRGRASYAKDYVKIGHHQFGRAK